MFIYQISLNGGAFDARSLTWDEAIAESQCKPDTAWIDPIHKRRLLKGEFGCSVSHLRVWEKIAKSNANGIILEEDVVFDNIDTDDVESLLSTYYDSVWLGYRFNDLGYWYNCHAYAITPDTARLLIDGFKYAIIPADEWVPLKLKNKQNYFYKKERVKQIPRSVRPSTIEDSEMLEGTHVNFRIITIATDETKMWALDQSAKKYGVEITNIGKDHPWRDEMQGMGGMPKIQIVNEYLSTVPPNDIILFMDGYDTFLADNPETILERFLDMDADIVFGAEANHWPLGDSPIINEWPETGTDYKFLNSGLYMGKASALHKFITHSVNDNQSSQGDDQLFCQRRYLQNLKTNDLKVKLDVEAYIFQNDDPDIQVFYGQLYNEKTKCCGCIYHGNGGVDAKLRFIKMADLFGFVASNENPSPYYMKLDYDEVAPEILVTDFMTETQCNYLIQRSEGFGNWGQMEGDKFPAQEIRLKQLGLWHEYERLWYEKLGKISEKHWRPMLHHGLRDAFTMKYSMETQKALGFHTDASLVTGSVKLNDNFEGAELMFPRQNFDNSKVKVGQCILFPSEVTHGHYVPELKSGIKYSLTMWTSRYKGDLNG